MKGCLIPALPSRFILEPNTHDGGIDGDPLGMRQVAQRSSLQESGLNTDSGEALPPGGKGENAILKEHRGTKIL